jgi:hypothetical protein
MSCRGLYDLFSALHLGLRTAGRNLTEIQILILRSTLSRGRRVQGRHDRGIGMLKRAARPLLKRGLGTGYDRERYIPLVRDLRSFIASFP